MSCQPGAYPIEPALVRLTRPDLKEHKAVLAERRRCVQIIRDYFEESGEYERASGEQIIALIRKG